MKRITCYSGERTILFLCLAMLIISTMLLSYSCSDDDKDMKRTETIIIAPNLELSGTMPTTLDKVPVMVATKENSDQKYYLHIGRIKGFEYTEGYEYKLKVLITTIKNPPMDGHLETFELVEIISKTQVQSE